MAVRAVYELTCEHLPFVTVADRVPTATLSVRLVPSQDEYTPFVVTVADGPVVAVEAAFDAVSFVAGYTSVDQSGETPRYKVLPARSMDDQYPADFDVAGLKALADTDSIIEHNRVTPTGWVQSGRFADRATVAEFRAFWRHNGAFDLRKLEPTPDEPRDDPVTDCQREALLTAAEMGHFDVPRNTSLAEVATALDISASSLSERLRRGHSALIEASLADRSLQSGRDTRPHLKGRTTEGQR
ncbi:helix-turn-helix domain-containing protein [Halorhabdus salina]|uniref:helix-turn-helix domain-containing protein n=1 Tax=Halorhabdus salina TaxID=2750670 RepID=UPI0015EEB6A8|nr:helix-turn-helix domain-containing protein [Halorhabdus salina]